MTLDPMTYHLGGKLEVVTRRPLENGDDLSVAYTPGVAEVCREIAREPGLVHTHTIKGNSVAIVTDGTAILGLGDLGPAAALPVMEGKAALFKTFAGVDGFPIALDTRDEDEIVRAVQLIAPVFGGINLEDISAPRCFRIENRLKELLDIPVFHDDQHGTAIVTMAGMINALKIVGKKLSDVRIVMGGAGAAGIATARILMGAGATDVVVCDRQGTIHRGRAGLEGEKAWMAENSNASALACSMGASLKGADIFIGVSGPNLVTEAELRTMNPDPIVFALANPDPEVLPEIGQRVARVFATGRSDYPNQINNVLAFPGVFRAALDCRARAITEEMKRAAAEAIASVVTPDELDQGTIIPSVFNPKVVPAVVAAVTEAARASAAVTV
jgi:malate dehydrogenase (oxaloacetate-decarboxylating)